MCANEEPLQNTAERRAFMSHNICHVIKLLTNFMILYTTPHHLAGLEVTILAYDKLLHNCDIKAMIFTFQTYL